MTEAMTIDQLLAPNSINEAPQNLLYSRANGGEVAPGVATPLTADFYRLTSGAAMCAMFYALGAMTKAERGPAQDGSQSAVTDRFAQFLFGRLSSDFDYALGLLGRVPGVDPAVIEEQLTGSHSDRVKEKRSLARTASSAAKIARLAITLERRVTRYAIGETAWWHQVTTSAPTADLTAARRLWSDALRHMRHGQALQCIVAATHPGAVQPLMSMVAKRAPTVDASQVVAGAETLEAVVLASLWEVAHGTRSVEKFIHDYGFYAPHAGELSSLSWRQNPSGLDTVLAGYRLLGEAQSPTARIAEQHAKSATARAAFLSSLSAATRRVAKTLIKRADRMTALRERGKTLMLMGADAARAAAVRIGELLAADGVIAEALDVFLLAEQELRTASATTRLQDDVARRKQLRNAYERLEIPINFVGGTLHDTVRAQLEGLAGATAPTYGEVLGDGVSSGTYTGVARVIRDPATTMLEPGEVLVCSSTDPGWAPMMTFAGAIVLDLGSMLSHGAIVAREMGIPCVANTLSGTNRIPDGATVTVNGVSGVVSIHPSAG